MNFHFFSQEICGIINYVSGVGSRECLWKNKNGHGATKLRGGGERGRGTKVALLNNFLPNYATAMKFRERKTQTIYFLAKYITLTLFYPFTLL